MLENAGKESEIRTEATYTTDDSSTDSSGEDIQPVESILGFPAENRITFGTIPCPIFELGGQGCYYYRDKTEEAAYEESSYDMLRTIAFNQPAEILFEELFHCKNFNGQLNMLPRIFYNSGQTACKVYHIVAVTLYGVYGPSISLDGTAQQSC